MLNSVAKKLLVLSVVFSPVLALAATPEEANALLNEAAALYEADGKDKTFAEITNPDGKFVMGELYIFVYDSDGMIVAHGGDPVWSAPPRWTSQMKMGNFMPGR